MNEPLFLVVDLFCGAGGTSTGFHRAELRGQSIVKVIACVNHDPIAIRSHKANYPNCLHFTEDMRTLDLAELIRIVAFYQAKYPNSKLILWASLECTNFSKAKGGQPRDADSRTLADHLERYILAIEPDYVKIENVVEFMSWGPLDENGKPISRKNGQDFMRWRKEICEMGYVDEWQELNSANFGAYTSRNRLFGVFAKPWLPIAWPAPTHSKKPSNNSMYGDLKKWMPVKEVLDFTDEGISILTRAKALSDKTLERIYAGLIKYVAKGDTAFISKYFSGKPSGKNITIDGPAGTVTCIDSQALVQTEFLLQTYAADSKGHNTFPIDKPARTITTRDSTQLVQPTFLTHYYGSGGQLSSIEVPAPTIPTKARTAIVKPEYFIDRQFGKSQNQSIEQPAGSIMPVDKHRLISTDSFILNPSHGGHNTSTDKPCPVIVARQDKAPLYLVQAENGPVQVAVYDGDSEIMIKIKQFMVVYGLVDIKMRMLRVQELLRIQGFPEGYVLEGNQSDQKKFIGNSVVPHVVTAWIESLAQRIVESETLVA